MAVLRAHPALPGLVVFSEVYVCRLFALCDWRSWPRLPQRSSVIFSPPWRWDSAVAAAVCSIVCIDKVWSRNECSLNKASGLVSRFSVLIHARVLCLRSPIYGDGLLLGILSVIEGMSFAPSMVTGPQIRHVRASRGRIAEEG
ncbi:uncharacterized protein B0I36DRAFT_351025 [Microdochium trichocladiopsis]|uniref:Uncharacterized protein n=1 Tax=Microdochium trichocladiopsis TaxID=1682393 RepID=A0A9P9BKY0_9PEZI|nr:uncharacterized protein B0I36DRAFT_351025 [Microdochium trichocladiopsis]KAH7027502.1 hypothetical protein B0I36DRAFT_351025 [Microdochium trichocladiopsis]